MLFVDKFNSSKKNVNFISAVISSQVENNPVYYGQKADMIKILCTSHPYYSHF
jgi:hypothetical protein